MIGVIDYGVGNIKAFLNLFARLNLPAERLDAPSKIFDCSHLILPGVGHFDQAMGSLNASGLRPALEQAVIEDRTPILGVCVGMQMLGNRSEEGKLPGLGWIEGEVLSFNSQIADHDVRSPHMGWNKIKPNNENELFNKGSLHDSEFYFLHSYYFSACNQSLVSGETEYGLRFDAAISSDNIHGIQCHPEKSHAWGERLLKTFSGL